MKGGSTDDCRFVCMTDLSEAGAGPSGTAKPGLKIGGPVRGIGQILGRTRDLRPPV